MDIGRSEAAIFWIEFLRTPASKGAAWRPPSSPPHLPRKTQQQPVPSGAGSPTNCASSCQGWPPSWTRRKQTPWPTWTSQPHTGHQAGGALRRPARCGVDPDEESCVREEGGPAQHARQTHDHHFGVASSSGCRSMRKRPGSGRGGGGEHFLCDLPTSLDLEEAEVVREVTRRDRTFQFHKGRSRRGHVDL